jgi:hypothetical protein
MPRYCMSARGNRPLCLSGFKSCILDLHPELGCLEDAFAQWNLALDGDLLSTLTVPVIYYFTLILELPTSDLLDMLHPGGVKAWLVYITRLSGEDEYRSNKSQDR